VADHAGKASTTTANRTWPAWIGRFVAVDDVGRTSWVRCPVCAQPLTTPASRAAGAGPVCRRKLSGDELTAPQARAKSFDRVLYAAKVPWAELAARSRGGGGALLQPEAGDILGVNRADAERLLALHRARRAKWEQRGPATARQAGALGSIAKRARSGPG
jgi:hypothetical protein